MKQLIARLRELEVKEYPGLPPFQPGNATQVEYLADLFEVYDALPQLLDRLERLERVAEATETVKEFSGHLKEDGTYWIVEDLMDAFAALAADEHTALSQEMAKDLGEEY